MEETMNDSPILNDKRAVVFGAGGSIGAAVARKFGAEGAEVFLAGRTEGTLAAVTRQITESGGRASYTVIDALDDSAVDEYLDRVVKQAGGIDIEFNATGPRITEYGNGKPAVDLPVAEFTVAQTVLTSQFITARGAARRMVPQGSGVIIFLTGSPARPHIPRASGIGAAFRGIANLMRAMALELTGTGIRVVCLRTAANPDTRTIQDTADTIGTMMNLTREQVLASRRRHDVEGVPAHRRHGPRCGPARIRSRPHDDRNGSQRHGRRLHRLAHERPARLSRAARHIGMCPADCNALSPDSTKS